MSPIRTWRAGAIASVLLLCVAGMAAVPAEAATARAATPGWTTSLAPTPTRPNGTLDAVSCPTTHWCMALGTYIRPDGSQLPGAVVFDAGGWHRTAIPAPTRTTSTTFQAQDCNGPTRCLVIYRLQQFDTNRWLVESWNGRRWHTITKVPWSAKQYPSAVVCADAGHCLVSIDAHDAFVRTRTGWRSVHIPAAKGSSGVVAGSCGATDDCTLVQAQSSRRLALVHWNGRRFGALTVTGLHVRRFLEIARLSCRVPSACVITGTDDSRRKPVPFIARWNGKRWSRVAVPSSVRGELLDGACTRRDGCYFAALATPNSEYGTHPYLLAHVGGKWIVRDRHVFALDCTGAAFCAASVPGNRGWSIIRLAGDRWHSAHVPNPAGYDATTYDAISCAPPTCVAVGETDNDHALAFAQLTAAGWRLHQVAALGGRARLNAVSCSKPHDCWAGGTVSSSLDPLLFHYDGSGWQRHAAPTGSSHLQSIDGISCPSTTFCMALGDQGGGVAVDRWDGTSWTAEDVNVSSFFASEISCTSASFCLAVGRASSGDDGMRWDGSTWHAVSGPSLDRVSCVTSTFCMATGRALSTSDPDTIAVWNGSSWVSRNYPHPGSGWDLNAVSCVAVNSCTVAGSVYPDPDTTVGFSETLANGSWHVHTAAGRGSFDQFRAIACPSAGTCRALGWFFRDNLNHVQVPIVGVLHQ